MAKYIHTADLHIGKSRSFPDYLKRQELMCDAVWQTAKDKSDGLVVIAGDIYDSPVLRPREKDLFIDKLSQADRDGITTVMINGNHDLIDQLDDGYTHLRTVKSLVAARRLKNTICIESEPGAFYLEKFKLGIIGVPALYRKTREVNAIVSTFTKQLRAQYGDTVEIVAVVHEAISGAVDETGFKFPKGVRLDPSIPVTAWSLGDIHACQQIPGVPTAYYSGCPIQHDFSDSARRGVLLVDTQKADEPEFISLHGKVQKLMTITVPADQDAAQVAIPADAIVRLAASKQQIAEMFLPDNVIRTKILNNSATPQPIGSVGLDDMFDGLVDILAEMGLDFSAQQFCAELTRKLQ